MFDADAHRVVDHKGCLKVAKRAAGLGGFAGLDEPRLGCSISGLEENDKVRVAGT